MSLDKQSYIDTPFGPLAAIARVLAHGAAKYGRFNWRRDPITASTYVDAIMRHLIAFASGEEKDPDSGESHLAHIGANVFVVLDAMAHGVCTMDVLPAPAPQPPSPVLSTSESEERAEEKWPGRLQCEKLYRGIQEARAARLAAEGSPPPPVLPADVPEIEMHDGKTPAMMSNTELGDALHYAETSGAARIPGSRMQQWLDKLMCEFNYRLRAGIFAPSRSPGYDGA